jgi:Secretion system C-terminal sorting domain
MIFLKKTFWFALLIPAIILWFGGFTKEKKAKSFHSQTEMAFFAKNKLDPSAKTQRFSHSKVTVLGEPTKPPQLLIDSNILFPNARVCGGCHGRDTQGIALVNAIGDDVNMYDDWRASIMGNSARDPFWRAKVEHESLVNPAHAIELQDKCTSCHAPTGHYQAKIHDKKDFYSLADVLADTIGLDGVTCQACHAQAFDGIGSRFSGDILFDTSRVAYGQYEQIFAPPMKIFVGITPKYGDQILDAGLCASCHSLVTKTVDLSGEFTGGTFVEQATYHEWLNSKYNDIQKTCQSCHLPELVEPVIIADNYVNIQPKSQFGVHEMVGGNTLMLNVLRENRAALGIEKVLPEMFDSTIAATTRMLQHKTLDLVLTSGILSGDTLFFDLKLKNKAGHKFPSGYPSRRAFVQFEVTDAQTGQKIFETGAMNPDFSLKNESLILTEPHHDVIRSAQDVQIYEFVAGDVNGDFTTVLERGAMCLKDNRLPPLGFSTIDARYDSTKIVGAAATDADFNFDGAQEGWGGDVLHFHIPNNGFDGQVNVRAKVLYQTMPPKWMQEIFATDGSLINTWKSMFYAADRTPVTIAEAALIGLNISSVSTKNVANESLVFFPNPVAESEKFYLKKSDSGLKIQKISVFSANGKLVFSGNQPNSDGSIPIPKEKGIYLISVETNSGRFTEKVIRN